MYDNTSFRRDRFECRPAAYLQDFLRAVRVYLVRHMKHHPSCEYMLGMRLSLDDASMSRQCSCLALKAFWSRFAYSFYGYRLQNGSSPSLVTSRCNARVDWYVVCSNEHPMRYAAEPAWKQFENQFLV